MTPTTPQHSVQPSQKNYEEVGGRYFLIRRIGKGGNGETWVAFDQLTRELVCLKRIRYDLSAYARDEQDKYLDRILAEIREPRQVHHSHIVRQYDLVSYNAHEIIFSMEFLCARFPAPQNPDEVVHVLYQRRLQDWSQTYEKFEAHLRQRGFAPTTSFAYPWSETIPVPAMNWIEFQLSYQEQSKQLLPLAHVRHVFQQMVEALRYLHSLGLVHRDIKPENIVLLPPPKNADIPAGIPSLLSVGIVPKIVDLATVRPAGRPTTFKGTLQFQAPETLRQQNTRKANKPPADIFALGGLLFELLTDHPFSWAWLSEVNEGSLNQERQNKTQLRGLLEGSSFAPSPSYIPERVHPAICQLLPQLLHTHPEQRPTANEILQICQRDWEEPMTHTYNSVQPIYAPVTPVQQKAPQPDAVPAKAQASAVAGDATAIAGDGASMANVANVAMPPQPPQAPQAPIAPVAPRVEVVVKEVQHPDQPVLEQRIRELEEEVTRLNEKKEDRFDIWEWIPEPLHPRLEALKEAAQDPILWLKIGLTLVLGLVLWVGAGIGLGYVASTLRPHMHGATAWSATFGVFGIAMGSLTVILKREAWGTGVLLGCLIGLIGGAASWFAVDMLRPELLAVGQEVASLLGVSITTAAEQSLAFDLAAHLCFPLVALGTFAILGIVTGLIAGVLYTMSWLVLGSSVIAALYVVAHTMI